MARLYVAWALRLLFCRLRAYCRIERMVTESLPLVYKIKGLE